MIKVASSFSKTSVFTKTQSLQVPPVTRAYSKSPRRFRDGLGSADGRRNPRNKVVTSLDTLKSGWTHYVYYTTRSAGLLRVFRIGTF